MSKEIRENIDKFLNFLNKRKIKVGDDVLCIKDLWNVKDKKLECYGIITSDDKQSF